MEIMQRKLFVGGISREATEANLREYFVRFGELDDCVIIHDRDTGCSKGFGFVSFIEPSMAEQALSHQHHAILGKRVDVKPARPRGQRDQDEEHDSSDNGSTNTELSRVKKIFVGGLPDGLTIGEFRNYFESYGSIEDAVVMHDGDGKPRGFGFVTFESEDAASHVLQQTFHELKSKMVEVKRAEPKERLVYGLVETYDSYRTGLAYQKSLYPWESYGPYMYYPLPIPFYPYGYNNICFGQQYYTQDSNLGHLMKNNATCLKPRSVDIDTPSRSSSINGGMSGHCVPELLREKHSDGIEIMNNLTFVDMMATSENDKAGTQIEFLDCDEGNQTEVNESGSVVNASSSTSNADDESDIAPDDDNETLDFASGNLKTMIDSTMRKMSMIRPLN